jgi:hypothetical protein
MKETKQNISRVVEEPDSSAIHLSKYPNNANN